MADEQTASERWIEERTLRYPTNPGKEYEYGLTPEEEGTQDAWAYDYPMAQHLLRLPAKIVGALTPYRRRIITPSETIMEPVIDAPSDTYRKTVTAPEYGPREFAIPYMPVRQGLAAFAEGLKTSPRIRRPENSYCKVSPRFPEPCGSSRLWVPRLWAGMLLQCLILKPVRSTGSTRRYS